MHRTLEIFKINQILAHKIPRKTKNLKKLNQLEIDT